MKSMVIQAIAATTVVLSLQTTSIGTENARCHFDMFCNYYVYLLQERGVNATEVFMSGKDRLRASVLLPDGKMECPVLRRHLTGTTSCELSRF